MARLTRAAARPPLLPQGPLPVPLLHRPRRHAAALPDWRGRVYLIDLHRLAHHPLDLAAVAAEGPGPAAVLVRVAGVDARDRLAFWRRLPRARRRGAARTAGCAAGAVQVAALPPAQRPPQGGEGGDGLVRIAMRFCPLPPTLWARDQDRGQPRGHLHEHRILLRERAAGPRRLRDLHRRPGPPPGRRRPRGPPVRLPLGRRRPAGRRCTTTASTCRAARGSCGPGSSAPPAAARCRGADHDVTVGFDKMLGPGRALPAGRPVRRHGRPQPAASTAARWCARLVRLVKAFDPAHRSFAALERRQYLGGTGRWSSPTAKWSAGTSSTTTASAPRTCALVRMRHRPGALRRAATGPRRRLEWRRAVGPRPGRDGRPCSPA